MAVVMHEDAPARSRAPASAQAVDTVRLLVWIAAAGLPWAAIALAARTIIAG